MPSSILTPSLKRFTLFPIEHPQIWAFYKKALASFWTVEEVDLSCDLKHFDSLTDDEYHFITRVLAFFAAADGIVSENLCETFSNEVQIPEARAFYGFQIFMEGVHNEMYSLLIETYVKSPEEKYKLFNAITEVPAIKAKADWAMQWMDKSTATFAERLVAFAVVEGVYFCSSFCAIFWLKKRGLMNALSLSNEFISRDESIHTEFSILLHSLLSEDEKASPQRITEIVTSAVPIEQVFAEEALRVPLLGINAGTMSTYIEFVADRLLISLDVEPHYNAKNPFEFMELISLQGKTNFFERRVAEYAKANVNTEYNGVKVLDTDADF